MSCAAITIKRGSTLVLQHRVAFDGRPADITGWSFKSEVRAGDQLLGEFSFVVKDPLKGHVEMRVEVESSWPLVAAAFDVRYTLPGGEVVYTDTLSIAIKEGVTQ